MQSEEDTATKLKEQSMNGSHVIRMKNDRIVKRVKDYSPKGSRGSESIV